LTAAFSVGDYRIWMTCEALSPHAQVVTQYIFTSDLNLLQLTMLLQKMSSYDETQGRHNIAYERVLDAPFTREKVLDSEHPDTPTSTNNLTVVLYPQGKYVRPRSCSGSCGS